MILRDWQAEKKDLQEAFDIIADKLVKADIEIMRLKEENAHFAWRDADKNKLITDMANALENGLLTTDGLKEARAKYHRDKDLVRRARKVVPKDA